MGKVRDEAPARSDKPSPSKANGSKGGRGRFAGLLANLLRGDVYKPTQGRQARLWTGVGLGVIVVAGLYTLYQQYTADSTPPVAFGIPAAIGLALGWFIYRLLHYPPFADFLIATEAEMNKVSWIGRQDLIRATIVVLTTVLLISVFLFGVDLVWSSLLEFIGVLRVRGFQAEG